MKKYFVIKKTTNFGCERYIVKCFLWEQVMLKFLDSQSGSEFIRHETDGPYGSVPQESGTYICDGAKYYKVINLYEPEPLALIQV